MTKNEILTYLTNNKQKFKTEFGVEKIGLFGSFARDEATKDSDIDLVIDMKPKSLKKRLSLKQKIKTELNTNIDLGYLSSLRNFIVKDIQKDLIYV
jgi:uncharacterized protein